MQKFHPYHEFFFLALISILTCLAFLQFSPYHVTVPHRDSGIFLNIGAEILRGKVLYLETWDNKQPLLYFIDVLGLWLGKGSMWGVWGVELVFFLAMLLTGYRILRQKLPPFGSFFVSMASFFTVFLLMGGNYSEEYVLLFQMGILAVLFFVYLPNRKRHSRVLAAVGIGVFAGLCFCIKQTYLDVAFSVLLFLLFVAWLEKDRQIIRSLFLIGLGFLLANLPFWLYFFKHGALNDYIINAFLFNKYYVSLGLVEFIHSMLEKIEFLTTNPFFMMISSIWLASVFILLWRVRKVFQQFLDSTFTKWVFLGLGLACLILFFFAKARGKSAGIGLLEWSLILFGCIVMVTALLLFLGKPAAKVPAAFNQNDFRSVLSQIDWFLPGPAPLLFLGLIELPAVLLTIAISGKDFTHYYISLFPALFLLLAGGLAYLYPIITGASKEVILNSVLAALLISGLFEPMLQIYNTSQSSSGNEDARAETASYLKSVTTLQDKILVWGWESVIYFLADRESPTRYAFQFPAYLDSPYKQSVLDTLLEDIQKHPALYIADTMDGGMPLIEGRSSSDCLSGSQVKDAQMLAIISFVCSNYDFDRRIENIYIYKLHNTGR